MDKKSSNYIMENTMNRLTSHLPNCVKTSEQLQASSPSVWSVRQPSKTDLPTTFSVAPTITMAPTPTYKESVEVYVSKDYMKFNAAHFIAFKGFREKLHGHNYCLAVSITGQVGPDGYVMDFGEIKKISRVICKDLNDSFLVPMNSDALEISLDKSNIHIVTEDQAKFSFPKSDCSLLPIAHSSAEELAIYINNRLVDAFTLNALLERGVQKVKVILSEADRQFASFERVILANTCRSQNI